MSTVTVRIPTPLRAFTGGADEVPAHGATVGEALTDLGARYNGLVERVLSPEGEVRQFVNVYVGSQNIRTLRGLTTPLTDGDVLSIVPAVAGGRR
jgi:sulfur-carrier protein